MVRSEVAHTPRSPRCDIWPTHFVQQGAAVFLLPKNVGLQIKLNVKIFINLKMSVSTKDFCEFEKKTWIQKNVLELKKVPEVLRMFMKLKKMFINSKNLHGFQTMFAN